MAASREATMLVRLPTSLKQQLTELARVSKRSTNSEVEFALERYVFEAQAEAHGGHAHGE